MQGLTVFVLTKGGICAAHTALFPQLLGSSFDAPGLQNLRHDLLAHTPKLLRQGVVQGLTLQGRHLVRRQDVRSLVRIPILRDLGGRGGELGRVGAHGRRREGRLKDRPDERRKRPRRSGFQRALGSCCDYRVFPKSVSMLRVGRRCRAWREKGSRLTCGHGAGVDAHHEDVGVLPIEPFLELAGEPDVT